MSVDVIIPSLIPVIIFIVSVTYRVYRKHRNKFKVNFLSENNRKMVDEAMTFYVNNMPPEDRIPPKHLKNSIYSKYTAKSKKSFKKGVLKKNEVHLALLAIKNGRICGFLKAIYIPKRNYVFIAYLISVSKENVESSFVTSKLVNAFLECVSETKMVDFILFEIVEGEKSKAKERLFKHIAGNMGFTCKRIDTKYFVPEICSFDEGDCEFYDSKLFYIPVLDKATKFTKKQYFTIIKSIYRDIYLESYRVSEPQLVKDYRVFTEMILDEIEDYTEKMFEERKNRKIDLI